MELLDQFRKYMTERTLVPQGSRMLLAVSGGVDSMVMLDLFAHAYRDLGLAGLAVAHVNFGLRGDESDGDQRLVEQTCASLGVECHTVRFDTAAESEARGESIQMAARRLRYDWFGALCAEHGYARVAIAHHGDDAVETFFINLMRGTGLRGLTGIAGAYGLVVRPLLFACRDDITAYAAAQGVVYRNDSSNESLKYLRNRLRHEVLPLFSSSSARFVDTMEGNFVRLTAAQEFIDREMGALRTAALRDNVLDLSALRPYSLSFQLFELLHPYGFPSEVLEDLARAVTAGEGSGKQFLAPAWTAAIDRGRILLSPRETAAFVEERIGVDDPRIEWLSDEDAARLLAGLPGSAAELPPHETYMAADALQFPLLLRRWADGDWFIPLGMRGQKKVSDFLVDIKMPLPDKERQGVLVSGKTIVWLVGQRLDDRYKVTPQTRRVIRITI